MKMHTWVNKLIWLKLKIPSLIYLLKIRNTLNSKPNTWFLEREVIPYFIVPRLKGNWAWASDQSPDLWLIAEKAQIKGIARPDQWQRSNHYCPPSN